MTLKNLQKIGRLEEIGASPDEVTRLLDAARRSLSDSHVEELSSESQFDLAYRGVLQAGLAALLANGYRPVTSSPGHHMTILQSLPKTIGVETDRVLVLDTLRKKRNLTDYTGAPVDAGSVAECQRQAAGLIDDVETWAKRKGLIRDSRR